MEPSLNQNAHRMNTEVELTIQKLSPESHEWKIMFIKRCTSGENRTSNNYIIDKSVTIEADHRANKATRSFCIACVRLISKSSHRIGISIS